jgi:hypothetical protein
MKKLATLLIPFLFFSCAKGREVEPIEKYRGKGIVLLESPDSDSRNEQLYVKNKDSVFTIVVPTFDAKNLKQGDTIK